MPLMRAEASGAADAASKQEADTPYNIFSRQKQQSILIDQLANERKEQRMKRADDAAASGHTRQFQLRTRKPSESHTVVLLPFSTDKQLRESYLNLSGGIRMGLLLEDLDSLAGEIAYKHTEGFHPERPVTIVTASVDRVELSHQLLPYFDLRLDGKVTWTGRSSMEIRINVDSKIDGQWVTCIASTFSMVAREKYTGGAAPIHSIEPETTQEKELFMLGEQNKQRRKLVAEHSLERKPPNDEERDLIHNIFLRLREQERNGIELDMSRWLGQTSGDIEIDNQHCKFIDATVLKNTMLMFPQQRNIHGKIFGGYLLRAAHETAFACAAMFAQSRPSFLSLDDNAFLKPVEVGTIVSFTAAIVYTTSSIMQVRVEVEVVNPQLGTRETTNVFHFAFGGPIRNRVLPRTYEEAILFLEGRRIQEKNKASNNKLRSML